MKIIISIPKVLDRVNEDLIYSYFKLAKPHPQAQCVHCWCQASTWVEMELRYDDLVRSWKIWSFWSAADVYKENLSTGQSDQSEQTRKGDPLSFFSILDTCKTKMQENLILKATVHTHYSWALKYIALNKSFNDMTRDNLLNTDTFGI